MDAGVPQLVVFCLLRFFQKLCLFANFFHLPVDVHLIHNCRGTCCSLILHLNYVLITSSKGEDACYCHNVTSVYSFFSHRNWSLDRWTCCFRHYLCSGGSLRSSSDKILLRWKDSQLVLSYETINIYSLIG